MFLHLELERSMHTFFLLSLRRLIKLSSFSFVSPSPCVLSVIYPRFDLMHTVENLIMTLCSFLLRPAIYGILLCEILITV